MTFPIKEERDFFSEPEVRQFFGARWEPREGDWIWTDLDFIQVLKEDHSEGNLPPTSLVYEIGYTCGRPDFVDETYLYGGPKEQIKKECIWLPRPDQLIEILEEKGYMWDSGIVENFPSDNEKYRCSAFTQAEVNHFIASTGSSWHPCHAKILRLGPTPAIALALALMEIG